MDPKYFGLNQRIGQLVKVPADQGRIVAIAVAMAAVGYARLPTSEVQNLSAFYAEQVYNDVTDKLSEINESVVFAAKEALALAQTFWKMRYYAAFPAQFVANAGYRFEYLIKAKVNSQMDLMTLWSGGATEVSDELAKFMNIYRVEIAIIAADVCALMMPRVEMTGGEDGALVRG